MIRFGDFSADAESGELFRKGLKTKLQGQPFEILLILLSRPGRVVTREELRSKLWPGDTFVDFEHGLNAAVNRLREALVDSADEPKFIETVPRRGYRFIGKIDGAKTTPEPAEISAQLEGQSSAAQSALPTSPHDKIAPALADDIRRSSAERWSALAIILIVLVAATFLFRFWSSRSEVSPQRTLTRVTFDPGLQIGATWSPDGRYLAFASNRGGKFDIWVQQINGGAPVQVTKGPSANWEPDWSPDGKYIAYRSEEGDGSIFIEPAIGGAGFARKVASFGHYPRWSPDGSRILFQSMKFGLSSKIFSVEISNPEVVHEVLPEVTSHAYIMSAAWHPDGKRVSLWGWQMVPTPLPNIWTGGVNSPGQVVRSELSPEVLKAVEDVAGVGYSGWGDTDFKLSWAPNGKELYFERMFRGARNIWRMRVNPESLRGESIERITTGGEVETEFSLSPDGNRVAFTSLSEQVQSWIFPINSGRGQITGPGKAVTNSGLEAWEGSLSRDGTKLAYSAKKAGRWEIWQVDLVQGTESVVAADDLFVRDEPQWSPDGKRLAYIRLRPASAEVQAVLWDTDKRSEVPLTEPQRAGLFIYDWAPDGKSILASADNPETGQTEVWQIPIDVTSSSRRDWKLVAARPGIDLFQARFSPDGHWIVFEGIRNSSRGLASAIFLVSAAGGEWNQLTDGQHWDDKPRWSPDGRMIYFLSGRSGFYNVFRVPVDPARGKPTGPLSQVTDFHDAVLMVARTIPSVDIDVTHDKLMVTTSQSSGSIWVLDKASR